MHIKRVFKVGASVWNDWMDTNSNIPAEKRVVGVEILHLDELGYGPRGEPHDANGEMDALIIW